MKDKERLIEEVVQLLRQSKLNYQIKQHLVTRGVEHGQMDRIIKEAKEIYRETTGKKRKVIWAVLTVLTFVLFYTLIPNSIYNLAPMIISTIGAALFVFFLGQSIADFRSWDEFNTKNKEEQDWRHKTVPLLVIPGLAMIFVFVMHFHANEGKELKEFGIKTKGTIIDGSSMKSRRGGIYEVTVNFLTNEGKSVTVSESVGEDEFRNFYQGQKVDLYYSAKDPNIIELLTNKATVKKYTGSEERDITPTDLIALLSIEKDSASQFLNQIKYGWQYDQKESVWYNDRSNAIVDINTPNEVRCLLSGISFALFPKELKEKGFTESDGMENNVKLYESDEYSFLMQMTMNGNQMGTLIAVSRN